MRLGKIDALQLQSVPDPGKTQFENVSPKNRADTMERKRNSLATSVASRTSDMSKSKNVFVIFALLFVISTASAHYTNQWAVQLKPGQDPKKVAQDLGCVHHGKLTLNLGSRFATSRKLGH